ncbi:MAG: CPBP family intramembrane metalloprotease [Oscillospiraceae bacterium]|nr:CPBP family intramembrane metalloprotease [Oscillospiraceae bacterium]
MNKIVKSKYLHMFILTAIIFLYQVIISKIGWKIATLFDYSSIDKDGIFMAVSVHHIFMLLISLGIMYVLYKTKKLDFKLKPKADKIGMKYTILYCTAVLIYFIFVYIIGIITNSVGGFGYEVNTINVIGTLGFQLFLSGTAEEMLFRALPLVCLKSVCNKSGKFFNIMILFITSLLFVYGHISFNVSLSSQLFSLVYVFIQGMAYGFVFLKSKSVIYPMIMHGVSNFICVGCYYLYMILFDAV